MKLLAKLLILMFLAPGLLHSQGGGELLKSNPKSDVFFQGFYWNSPPGGIWYDSLSRLAPRLASAGFGGIWFPSPVKGAAGGFSMGYDPYDHFDFGEFNQKGSRETRFGSRQELINAVRTFHNVGMEVFADAVMNHMNGGEAKIPYQCKPYPAFPDSAYLLFNYPNGSGRFKKDAGSFYPNSMTCDVNPPYHGASDPIFAFGEWLAKDKPAVRDSLIAWGRYLKQVIGFDGFRLDAVKSIDPAFMGPWLSAANGTGYAVAEYYGSQSEIMGWWNSTKNTFGGNTAMFDFPLRFTLRDMCNNTSGSFDMTWLDGAGLVNAGMSGYYVSTWVENHDVDRTGYDSTVGSGHDPIIYNKDLAYAYIMFSEGRPCVFFRDYVDYGFGGKIDTLVWVRQMFLGGGTTKRAGLNAYYIRQDNNQDQAVLARDIYIARRDGFGLQKGGYLVINDNPAQWIDIWVDTESPVGTVYKDFAGRDANKVVVGPAPGGAKNRVKLWAPPRSYTLYVADTTVINHPPVLAAVPDQVAYTNSAYSFRLNANDANRDPLTFSLTGNPSWLTVSQQGILSGTPPTASVGSSTVVVTVRDTKNAVAVDTFVVQVSLNRSPQLAAMPDTSTRATKRFQVTARATDPDNDPVRFSFRAAPAFLSIGDTSGIISGTPAVTDTGSYLVKVLAADPKGGFDSTSFRLHVRPNADSVVATYGKPRIDGTVNVAQGDWLARWQVVADPDTDSRWRHPDTLNNELMGIYSTWDADSLYIGVDYIINDLYNTMMLYIDAGSTGNGITNFNSNQGYNGDYAKNFRFRRSDDIEFFVASYNQSVPSLFRLDSNTSSDISAKINTKRGAQGKGAELAIAWNDIYRLGAGLVPPNVKLKFVALVAGGFNWGAGDAAPDNPDVNGDGGPDSLVNLGFIRPDTNGNGIPDPTVFITDVNDPAAHATLPLAFGLRQNFPNPFNPVTVITYDVPRAASIELAVYDVLGNRVAVLVNGVQQAGSWSVTFNATGLPSGIYIYRLQSGQHSIAKKLLLMK